MGAFKVLGFIQRGVQMTTNFKLLTSSSIVAMSLVFTAPAAFGQDSGSEGGLDEIIVKGQRKEQTILEVPISTSVFDNELIDTMNIQEAEDYLLQTPNVSFSKSGRNGAREIVISIRGISDVKGAEKVTTQSAFATNFDELGLGTLSSGQSNPPTYDIEAVEVLRGPQGVFFGRNSEGGAINIYTNKPAQDFYGRIDAGVGSFNTYELSGVINGGITDTLAGRLTVQHTSTEGPLKNVNATGGDTGNDFLAMRGQLRWTPTDATKVDLSINTIKDNQDYTPKLATCINPTFGFNPFDTNINGTFGCYDFRGEFSSRVADGSITPPAGAVTSNNTDFINQNTREFTDNQTELYIGRVEHDFGGINLVSITGYSDSSTDQQIDLDKSGLDSVDRTGVFKTDSFSQEVRLSASNPGRLDWTLGGFYYDESFHAENAIVIKDFLGPWLRGDKANENNIDVDRDGWAIFGNVEYDLNDSLSVILGGRYSEDDDTNAWSNVFAACPRRPLGAPLSAGCILTPDQQMMLPTQVDGSGNVFVTGGTTPQTAGLSGSNSSTDFSPRAALNWNPNSVVSAYASISKGYKPAGAQANPDSGFDNVSIFDKEVLWNYEIGGNIYLADRTILLQGAVFHMDWKDLQVVIRESFCNVNGTLVPQDTFTGTNCLITPVDRTVNANKATSSGVEVSGTVQVSDQLTVGGSVGYIDAKYKDFVTSLRNSTQDLSGDRLGKAPKWTLSANAQYDYSAFGGEGFVRGEFSHRSEASAGIVQSASSTFPQAVPSFSLVNLRVGQSWGRNKIVASVENVLEEEYFTGTDGFSWGGVMLDYNPRRFSVRFTTEFE